MTIAVLITVYNRKNETICCLRNLFNQVIPSGYSIEVYMTDDGCSDGTPEAVRIQFPQVNIIKGNGALFWNRGMWTAWNEAAKKKYNYYLWLNDDTFLYPDAVKCLLEAANDTNNKSIIVGVTTDRQKNMCTYGGRVADQIPIPSQKLTVVDCFNGNIVLVPSYVFEKVGNLDYYFTHSKGDFDYGLRAQKKGICSYQFGRFIGICERHKSMDKWCNPNVPFVQRWKAMWKPNGMPPHETFHFERRHYGRMSAALHYCTILLRCCFPKLWL